MRKRNIRHVVRLNEDENEKFMEKIEKCGVSKEVCLRSLISGYAPQSRFPNEYYEMIAELKAIGNYLKQRNIAEELKEKNQMLWVQEMNNIQNCINEKIKKQLIYK